MVATFNTRFIFETEAVVHAVNLGDRGCHVGHG